METLFPLPPDLLEKCDLPGGVVSGVDPRAVERVVQEVVLNDAFDELVHRLAVEVVREEGRDGLAADRDAGVDQVEAELQLVGGLEDLLEDKENNVEMRDIDLKFLLSKQM